MIILYFHIVLVKVNHETIRILQLNYNYESCLHKKES